MLLGPLSKAHLMLEFTAYHEAGHAVVCALTGIPIRYVTLRPRDTEFSGHVYHGRAGGPRPPHWLAPTAVAAAGAIAEDTFRSGHHRGDTLAGARDDLKQLRHIAGRARKLPQPDPAIPPDWTVRDVAAHAWTCAAHLLAHHFDAVGAVAEALLASTRAVTGAQVRELVTANPPRWHTPRVDTEFWAGDCSRMTWDPRPVRAATAHAHGRVADAWRRPLFQPPTET